MGRKHVLSAIPQEIHDETASTIETEILRDTPLQLPSRRPTAMTQRRRQFLYPVACLFLLCIGGPILLHELAINYLDGTLSQYGMIERSTLPCDVQGVWTSWSSLFEVNIRTRNLSFTTPKLIDVAFDILVGRGGQACLAWIAYRVYMDVLRRITENGEIRYDLFAAIALRPNAIRTLGTAAASVPFTNHLWTKFTPIWTVLAILYVLAYPPLVSAATSLVGATTTSIQLNNNGTAPINVYIASAAYSLAYSGRDNKPDPWIVPVAAINDMSRDFCNIMFLGNHQYSISGGNAIVVNGTTYMLGNKTQAICGFYYEDFFYSANMDAGGSSVSPEQFFASQVICVPDGHRYQWGASWELLVLITILHIVWSVSLLLMWLEVTRHIRLVRQSRKMDMWRAILDLAEPLLIRLGPSDGICGQGQLEDAVRNMAPVHYEAKVDGMKGGGYCQNVHLVSGFDTAVTLLDSHHRQLRIKHADLQTL
jgi:hypothetical protein